MKHHSISTFAALVCKLILVCFTCVSGQEANSLLWRVTARNGQVSHLYGTCHTHLRDAYMLREPALRAYKDAKIVAVEVDMISKEVNAAHAASMIDAINGMMDGWKASERDRFEIRDTLKALVTRLVPLLCKKYDKSISQIEQEYDHLSSVANAIKNIQTVNAEYLIGLVSTLRSELFQAARKNDSIPTLESAFKQAHNALDIFICRSAIEEGKRIVELDDRQKALDAVLSLFGSLSDPMAIVRKAVDDESRFWDMYRQEEIVAMNHQMVSEIDEKSARTALDERNRDWVRKLRPLIDSNTCFIAVGAAHLAGERGLIKLLRSNGMKVEPVLGGDRVDIRNHIGVSHNQGSVRLEKVTTATSGDASFKSSIAESVRSFLQRANQHGLLTLMISVTRRNEAGYDENDQLSIDFTDREDLLSEIMTIVRRTASSSDAYRKLDVNHTYNIVIQLEY